MYGVHATQWVAAMNDIPTPDLDAALSAIASFPSDKYVRIKLVDLKGQPKVVTLKPDDHYWSLSELRRKGSDWVHSDDK